MKKVFLVLAIVAGLIGCKKQNIEEIKPVTNSISVNIYPSSFEIFNNKVSQKEKYDLSYINGKVSTVETYLDTNSTGYKKQLSYTFEFDGKKIKKINMVGHSNQYVSYQYNYYYDSDGKIINFVRRETTPSGYIYGDSIQYFYDQNSQLSYFIDNIYTPSDFGKYHDSVKVTKNVSGTGYSFLCLVYRKDKSRPMYQLSEEHNWVIDPEKKTLSVISYGDSTNYKYSNQKNVLSDFNYIQYGIYGGIISPELQSSGLNTFELGLKSAYNPFDELIKPQEYENDIYEDAYGRVFKVVQLTKNQISGKMEMQSTTIYTY